MGFCGEQFGLIRMLGLIKTSPQYKDMLLRDVIFRFPDSNDPEALNITGAKKSEIQNLSLTPNSNQPKPAEELIEEMYNLDVRPLFLNRHEEFKSPQYSIAMGTEQEVAMNYFI
eukprot:snap_masked-scaffold_10-processed-gene-6.22-mRNA-1 protein AED:1.00 eAED:1.00 QI:0/-1/0/0/-1/1/1/0/113